MLAAFSEVAHGKTVPVDPFADLRKEEAEKLKPIQNGLPAVMPGDEHWFFANYPG